MGEKTRRGKSRSDSQTAKVSGGNPRGAKTLGRRPERNGAAFESFSEPENDGIFNRSDALMMLSKSFALLTRLEAKDNRQGSMAHGINMITVGQNALRL